MSIEHGNPDEVRREFVRLRQALDDAIKRREDLARRKAMVGPKVWAMAKLKPNLKTLASEIADLKSQLRCLIRQNDDQRV